MHTEFVYIGFKIRKQLSIIIRENDNIVVVVVISWITEDWMLGQNFFHQWKPNIYNMVIKSIGFSLIVDKTRKKQNRFINSVEKRTVDRFSVMIYELG